MASLRNILRALRDPRFARRALLRRRRSVVHVGNRAWCRRLKIDGVRRFRKTFSDPAALATEAAALRRFADRSWAPTLLGVGDDYIDMPYIDPACRLDRVAAAAADLEQRRVMAVAAISMLRELYDAGCAHRDFHAGNLFWVDGRLTVVDFECLQDYPADERPAFADCYDLTGRGLDSPHETFHMCWDSDSASGLSLRCVLGIDAATALTLLGGGSTTALNKQGS